MTTMAFAWLAKPRPTSSVGLINPKQIKVIFINAARVSAERSILFTNFGKGERCGEMDSDIFTD